jgi:hypothetical protein
VDGGADPWGHWKIVCHQHQTSCSCYRSITCFCTLYVTRKAVVPLSHSASARVSTARCTCKMCILSVDFATVGQRPFVYSKDLFTDKSCPTSPGITNIHNEHVVKWKSSCNLISPLAMTVFHQPGGWDLRWVPQALTFYWHEVVASITLTLWRLNFFWIIYKNSVRTSQETHYLSITKLNQLMLFRETVTVYCENHTEHTNTLCGQNAEF